MNLKKTTYNPGFNNEIGKRYLACYATSLQHKPPCCEFYLIDTTKIAKDFKRKKWYNYLNSECIVRYHKVILHRVLKMGIDMFENVNDGEWNHASNELLELQRDLERENNDDLLYLKQIKKL